MLLFRNDAVEDYFEVVEEPEIDEAAARHIATSYENGKAILLKGLKPEFDAEFFAGIEWPQTAVLKKLKSDRVVAYHESVLAGKSPAHDPLARRNSAPDQYSKMLTETFGGDMGRLDIFVENVRSLNLFLFDLMHRIFPSYKYKTPSYTYRLSDTVNENLHVDTYREDLPDHHVRLFINLDTIYRIWHTSHTLETMLANDLHRLSRDFLETATPGRICHELNHAVFGGFEIAGREGAPKHICFFEPGDVWLVDSRKVSHQIFYGRRAVSTEFQVEPDSMLNPDLHYYRMVDRYRARYLGSA